MTRIAPFGWLVLLGAIFLSSTGAAEGSKPAKAQLPETRDPKSPHTLPLLVTWSGSERCRPEADTLEHLRRLLGKDALADANHPLTFSARVVEHPGSIHLELSEIGGTAPPRLLEVRDCDELAQSLALVLSVWLQERTVTAPAPTPILPETPPVAPPSILPKAPANAPEIGVNTGQLRLRTVAFTARSPSTLKLELSVAPTVALGVLPRVDLGLAAELGLGFRGYSIRTGVLWLTPQTTWVTANSSRVGGRFSLVAGSLRVGKSLALFRHVAVEPALWTLLGRMQAEGREANTNAVSRGAWGAAGASTRVTFERAPFAFGLQMDVGVPFGRPRFRVDEILIFQAPNALGFAQLFVSYRFL